VKIAFLTRHDPHDRRSWSGILYYMRAALERHCGEVISVGPAGGTLELAGRAAGRILRSLFRYNIDASHTLALSKILGRVFSQRLLHSGANVIYAPVAATELAYLDTNLPIIYYGDLTARLFKDYAASVGHLSKWSLEQTELIEQRALRRAEHLVYASEWAAQSAALDYEIPRKKISVIPMGANLDETPPLNKVIRTRRNGPSKHCTLLFIGVDWRRKGGDVALAAMRELRSRGISASLTVIGCSPPSGVSDPYLRVIPFLDKSLPQDRTRMNELLLHSDFMVFPTRREAYGVVCCEANAFGLPLIASDAGGLPVWNGENGVLLAADAAPSAYADAVQALTDDPGRYFTLALSSRKLFETRLNWDAWGKTMAHIFGSVLEQSRSPHQPTTSTI
jgi:glycosyltransferase involved in cell wall biosynthesis